MRKLNKTLFMRTYQRLIAKTRAKAVAEFTTLAEVIRRFLANVAQVGRGEKYDAVMAKLGDCRSGGQFSRDDASTR
jgi:hypothetical protein